MQPVNDSLIQHQIISAQPKTAGKRDSAVHEVKAPLRMSAAILPEDIVTLSKDRSSALSLKKEPSAPVTLAESKALREVFSVYA
jgi:hypothetical protein